MADIHKYTLDEVLTVVPQSDLTPVQVSKCGLLFTLQAVDTFTKQPDGSYLLTSSVDKFSPVLTKAGDSVTPSPDNSTVPWVTPEVLFMDTPTVSVDCSKLELRLIEAAPEDSTEIIATDFMDHTLGKLWDIDMPLGPVAGLEEPERCYDNQHDDEGFTIRQPIDFTFPGATFTLQNGIPVPAYPTLVGSLVFDMQLKKWGKQAGEFLALIQFSPANATDGTVLNTTNFGMDSGVLAAADNTIKLFTLQTAQSLCRYGKIALHRLGFTEMLEVTINFRLRSTGTIVVDGSIDARTIDTTIQHVETFTNALQVVVKCHVAAMWHTLSISGNFDLQYMEFRGIMASRR